MRRYDYENQTPLVDAGRMIGPKMHVTVGYDSEKLIQSVQGLVGIR